MVGSRIRAMSGDDHPSVKTAAQPAAAKRGIGPALVLALLATSCGQKGPLTLPAGKPAPAAASQAASSPSRTP
jgi:predicted small lipoprotein YifL